MAHLYIADGLVETAVGATIELAGAEARHASSVSRLRVGESVLITNGVGLLMEAQALNVAKDQVTLRVDSLREVAPRPIDITLVQALAKGDRDERAIEMATELGVSRVIPWQASRSVSRWDGDKAVKGQARWQSIVREASKQSVRAWIPEVEQVATTHQVATSQFAGLTIVLDPSGQESIGQVLERNRSTCDAGIRLIVGPEGGVSSDEITTLVNSGAVVVGLGTNILRTSTAGPAVIAVLNELLGRW